jgi:hypothetical protein
MLVGALVVAGVFVAAGRGDRRPRRPPVARVWGLLPLVPAAVLVGYAVRGLFLSRGTRVEWFLGGDHVRHLLSVADERIAGTLTYAHQVYPRAWHTLVAGVWSASGAKPDAAGFVSLVDQMSTAVWLLAALLALVTGRLGAVLGRRCGLSPAGVGVSGLVAGALALMPSFMANYLSLGFENSHLAAVLLAVVAIEVVERPDTPSALVVCATSAALMAHTWQLLMVPVGVGVAICAVTLIRRAPVSGVAWTLVTGAVSLAVAAPGLLSVVSSVGIGHATDAGVVAPLPRVLLPLGVIGAVVLGFRRRRDWRVVACVAFVLVPCVTGLALAARVGISPTQYYPSKLIWHTAALGLAPLGVLTAQGLVALRQRSSAVAVVGRAVATAALVLVAAYAFATPAGAQLHTWSRVDGATVLTAVTTPDAQSAQVVWLGRGHADDDRIVRVLLDYYRVAQTTQRTPQGPLTVAEECQLLHASPVPAVLSDQPADAVAARYSCARDVHVVRLASGQGR